MGWFDKLQNLVDVTLDIDIASKTVNIKSDGESDPISLSDDGETVHVDVGSVQDEETREKVMEAVFEGYQEEEEILRNTVKEDRDSIKEDASKDRIEETLEFFRPKIPDRHLNALEAALYLREAWERDEPIDKKKQDIVEKYGPEGRSIANLCTAGYFDEGGYLRQLYQEMKESEDWKEGNYQEEFVEIVKNEPFSVFVSWTHGKEQVKSKIVNKLLKYKKYGVDVKFIDVRGIGEENKEKIQDAMESLEEQVDNIEYDDGRDEGQYRVRINPESVEGLASD
ncbi:MAG: hypothetical protein ABEJ72_01870 [Candidatus Aenigmatarchaeota archaeon]